MEKMLYDAGALDVKKLEPEEMFKDKVEIYKILYPSDGFKVTAYVAFSKHLENNTPALIFNRGGNRDFGMLTPDKICGICNKSGFVTLGSQYRGNDGGTGTEDFGKNDANDVVNLVTFALKLSCVNKNGVYMMGRSRGGMMTYRACAMDTRIKAAAIGAGLSDCRMMYTTREDSMKQVFHELVGGTPDELPDEYSLRSAVDWADKIKVPIFIGQGDNDWRVVPDQARNMAKQLEKYHKIYEYKEYPGGDHSLKGTTFMDDALSFLKKFKL